MQWDDSANGGFTSGSKPWLEVNPNYKTINAKQEAGDPESIYNYFSRMLAFRRTSKAFVYGTYRDLDPENAKVFAYTRTLGTEKYLVVLNFSRDAVAYPLPGGLQAGKLVMSNLGKAEANSKTLALKGWEARVYQVGQ
jgi:oligo-1,6-glucosidase